jgi:hypothetical protein
MNQPELPDHITLRQPPDLAFSDQVRRLVSLYRSLAASADRLRSSERNTPILLAAHLIER